MSRLALFAPPFRRLRFLVFLYLIVCFALAPSGMVHSFRFSSAREAWFAFRSVTATQPFAARIEGIAADPVPAFVDALPALLAQPLSRVMEPWNAAILSSILWPLVFLGLFFALLPSLAAGFLPRSRRQFAAVFVPFAPALLARLAPGAAMPDMMEVLAAGLAAACLFRAVALSQKARLFWLTGVLFALFAFFAVRGFSGEGLAAAWTARRFFQTAFLPLLAVPAAVWGWRRAGPRRRLLWLTLGILWLSSFTGMLFWESFSPLVSLFSLAPLAWLGLSLFKQLASLPATRGRYLLEFFAAAMMGIFPVAFMPAVLSHAPFVPGVLFFAGARSLPPCDIRLAAEYLEAPWNEPASGRLVFAAPEDGPELLLRTRSHRVFGKALGEALGAAPDPKRAMAEAGVSYLLVCRHRPAPFSGPFGASLREDRPPKWLKRVEIPFDNDYLLFKIVKDTP